MVWWTQPLEVRSTDGDGHSGKWRMTCESDETGRFVADESHEHDSPEECMKCATCEAFASSVTGVGRVSAADIEERELLELARLKRKYETETQDSK